MFLSREGRHLVVAFQAPPGSQASSRGEEGSGPRVLLKSGPGNRGRSACGPTHVARLEFPRETGLILRCAGMAGNPFQTTQGNRLSCRDQDGEGNGNPLQFSCLEYPRDGGACWVPSMGLHRVGHD